MPPPPPPTTSTPGAMLQLFAPPPPLPTPRLRIGGALEHLEAASLLRFYKAPNPPKLIYTVTPLYSFVVQSP